MSSIHKTGANRVFGAWGNHTNQISALSWDGVWVSHDIDPASSDKALRYDFIPTNGVISNGWSSSTQGRSVGGLRRFNGITHNASTPYNFEFDGTDDYLGNSDNSSNYGGNKTTVWAEQSWTMCQWFKYNNVNHYAFYLTPYHETDPDVEHLSLEILTSNDKAKLVIESDHYSVSGSTTFDFTFTSGKWYYIALTSDHAGNYEFYVNGSFVGDSAIGRSYARWLGNVNIGRKGGNSGWSYTGAGTKVGHVHIYDDQIGYATVIGGSAIRQNFLATHKMFSDRIYGDTFGA